MNAGLACAILFMAACLLVGMITAAAYIHLKMKGCIDFEEDIEQEGREDLETINKE